MLLGGTAPAYAQFLEPEPPRFQIDRNVPVGSRTVPGYEAPGIRVGSFTLSPSVTANAIYSDNIFAQESDKQDDIAVRLAPTLRLKSNWSVHSLKLTAAGRVDRYASLTSENVEHLDLDAAGAFQVGPDTRVQTRLRWQSLTEPRSSQYAFTQTRKPLEYQAMTAAAGVTHTVNRLRLIGEVALLRTDYARGIMFDGTPLDTRSRDNDRLSARARVEFAQTPGLSYFVQATVNRRDFKAATVLRPKRDSKGFEVLGGIRFEPSELLRGEIGAGYLRQQFRNPFYRDSGNLALMARVQYFPSPLTNFALEADRRVEDSGNPGSGAFVSTGVSLRADHELRRTLIVGATVDYERNKYNDISRRDRRFGAGVRTEYRLNRWLAINASASHLNVRSRGFDRYRSYRENRFLVGLSVRG